MKHVMKRSTAGLAASALVAGALTLTTFTTPASAAPGECLAPEDAVKVSVFGFNDFHGRLGDAAAMLTPVEEARADLGDENVLLLSSGDNIGASEFESFILDEEPTLEVLNAIELDVSVVGNHEFDRGWDVLSTDVVNSSLFPYLGANVYDAGTQNVAEPLQEFATFERGGVTIGVVGVVTDDTPRMVAPDGVSMLTFGDPVEAVNRVTEKLLDGDDANGEADVVVVSLHEGSDSGTAWDRIDERVSAIFNGHTHDTYTYETSTGIPVVQAGSYGEAIARVDLNIDPVGLGVCSTSAQIIDAPEEAGSTPRLEAVKTVVAEAEELAAELGMVEIGETTAAISTPVDGSANHRNSESPMTNMVAQMFAEVLGAGNDEFIGIQNPGGTRDSFDAGAVTYREAANVLPFANTLMTTEITGAQFKEVLEQQWQTPVPERFDRSFLPLGISDNVSYTYDEDRDKGDRITGVWINGEPIDMDKYYTVGSGSFLIGGGDNFTTLAEGRNTLDTGRADLEAWVEWVDDQGTLSPDYTRRGVSAKLAETVVKGGDAVTFTFGQPAGEERAIDTLDMNLGEGDKVTPPLANTSITAYIGDVEVGTGTVTDGVGTVSVSLPADSAVAAGSQTIRFLVEESGTEIFALVDVVDGDKDSEKPGKPSPEKPGKPGKPSPEKPSKPAPSKPRPGMPKTGF